MDLIKSAIFGKGGGRRLWCSFTNDVPSYQYVCGVDTAEMLIAQADRLRAEAFAFIHELAVKYDVAEETLAAGWAWVISGRFTEETKKDKSPDWNAAIEREIWSSYRDAYLIFHPERELKSALRAIGECDYATLRQYMAVTYQHYEFMHGYVLSITIRSLSDESQDWTADFDAIAPAIVLEIENGEIEKATTRLTAALKARAHVLKEIFQPAAKPKVKPRSKPKVKPRSKPKVKPRPKPRPKPKVKPRPKPRPKPKVKPRPKPKVKPKVKPKIKPKVKPKVKPRPKPKVKRAYHKRRKGR